MTRCRFRSYAGPPGSVWLFVLVLSGCGPAVSPEAYEAERRQKLLEIYPPGVTSRDDVRAKWKTAARDRPPAHAATRPAGGWDAFEPPAARDRVLASQRRTGRPVVSLEVYYGPDGFLGLCYVWYYYDDRDRVVDVEWQYASD